MPAHTSTHRWTEAEFYLARDAAPAGERAGNVYVSPLDVKLETGLVMQPDLLVVPVRHLGPTNDVVSKLLLAVEVISPSSSRGDRVTKRPRSWHPADASRPFELDIPAYFRDAAAQ